MTALTPITAATSGLPGLVGMLDRARALLDTASTLSDMREAQAVIDVAIAAARTLHSRQSPLTSEDQFQQVRDAMAEALILKHEALCRLAREIEAARRAMTRYVKRGGQIWIRVFPDVPITQKPLEVRMGSGKGNVEYWVAKIQPGKMLYEMEGVSEEIAREAFALASAKLPVKTTVIKRTAM